MDQQQAQRAQSRAVVASAATKGASFRKVAMCALALVLTGVLPAGVAWADAGNDAGDDGWGCQVLLCLADPRGPETEGACVPPIEKLWDALSHGQSFPVCDFSSSLRDLPQQALSALPPGTLESLGVGTGASNTWAGGGYCRPDMLYWGGLERSQLLCRARAAINVSVNGSLFTRVWWGIGGRSGQSVTEFYGQGGAQASYDPARAAADFRKEQQQQRQQQQQDSLGGGH
jgi:hypothetical protein